MEDGTRTETLIHPVCRYCGAGISPAWRYCSQCGRSNGFSGGASSSSRKAVALCALGALTSMGLALLLLLASAPRQAAPQPMAIVAAAAWNPQPQLVFSVPADHWISTGINVRSGATIQIEAQGQWNPWTGSVQDMGPDGVSDRGEDDTPCPSANWGSLVGRVGDGPYFPIGSGTLVTSSQGGELKLGINDDFHSRAVGDNTGNLEVAISGDGQRIGPVSVIGIPTDSD
jgi:hypothetical protein